MSSTALALVVTTGLCLSFSSTRIFGIIGVFLLITLYPVASSLFLVIGGVAYVRYRLRRCQK
jgi:hypothetical protein